MIRRIPSLTSPTKRQQSAYGLVSQVSTNESGVRRTIGDITDEHIRKMEDVSRGLQQRSQRKLNLQPTDIFNKKREPYVQEIDPLGMQNSLMKIPSVTRSQVKKFKNDLSFHNPQISILKPMDSFYKKNQASKQFSFTSINDAKPNDSGVFSGIKHQHSLIGGFGRPILQMQKQTSSQMYRHQNQIQKFES